MSVKTFDGQAISADSEEAIEGFASPALAAAGEPHALARSSPFSWVGSSPTGSMRVGWILKKGGKPIADFGFSINPQAINRAVGSRSQMFGTKGAFYVDDFGAGATTIQIQQLVASGQPITQPALGYQTLREHVLQFYDEIYLQAIGQGYSNSPVEVFFYDNHLYHSTREAAAIPERVYFPGQGSFSLTRSTTLHNVFQLQLTMITLDKPRNPLTVTGSGKPKTKIIIVRANETLKKLVVNQGGKHATHKRLQALEKAILKLNPVVRKNRKVPIFSPANTVTKIGEVEVKRMHVVKGQKLIVPA